MHSILHARSISAQIAVKCKNQTQTYQDNFHHAFLSVRAAFVCLVRNRDFDACSCKAPKLYHHQIVSPSTLQASSGPSSRHRKQGGDPDPTSKGKIPSRISGPDSVRIFFLTHRHVLCERHTPTVCESKCRRPRPPRSRRFCLDGHGLGRRGQVDLPHPYRRADYDRDAAPKPGARGGWPCRPH